jgi:hypothetical protein
MAVTTFLLDRQNRTAPETGRVSRSDEIAHAIFDQAVASARGRMRVDQQLIGFKELVQRPDFVDHFLRDLAVGVAQALASNDQRVAAVYAYEVAPSSGADASALSGALVSLLVVVTAPSAALGAFVASLNRALCARLSTHPGAHLSLSGPVLDINVVTEQEVRQEVGIARLLSAVVLSPVKLWQRKE